MLLDGPDDRSVVDAFHRFSARGVCPRYVLYPDSTRIVGARPSLPQQVDLVTWNVLRGEQVTLRRVPLIVFQAPPNSVPPPHVRGVPAASTVIERDDIPAGKPAGAAAAGGRARPPPVRATWSVSRRSPQFHLDQPEF